MNSSLYFPVVHYSVWSTSLIFGEVIWALSYAAIFFAVMGKNVPLTRWLERKSPWRQVFALLSMALALGIVVYFLCAASLSVLPAGFRLQDSVGTAKSDQSIIQRHYEVDDVHVVVNDRGDGNAQIPMNITWEGSLHPCVWLWTIIAMALCRVMALSRLFVTPET